MNIRGNDALRQKLASEYVLGTLKGGARRRFEGWLHNDADLRHITAEWRQRLEPMAEFATPVAPPKRVWQQIEQRLHLAPQGRWSLWRDALSFWRGLGLASSAIAALAGDRRGHTPAGRTANQLCRQPDGRESANGPAADGRQPPRRARGAHAGQRPRAC